MTSRVVRARAFVFGSYLLLPFGKVAARIVDVQMTSLLALGEVAAMLLLGRLGCLLLARGEATVVVVVVGVFVVIAVLVIAVLVVVTGIVVGMLAHVPWVSKRFL